MEKLLKYFTEKRAEVFKKHQALLEGLTNDVLNKFSWDAENLYKAAYMLKLLDTIIDQYNTSKGTLSFERIVDYHKEMIFESRSIMDRSTNPMASYCSLWRKETVLQLLDEMKWDGMGYEFSAVKA